MRIIHILVILAAILLIAIPSSLSYYDAATREKMMEIIAKELRPQASMTDMDKFMRHHTARYALSQSDVNLDRTFEYGGFLRQTRVDRFLFDRKVQIVLRINRDTKTFQGADVHVYYTFL